MKKRLVILILVICFVLGCTEQIPETSIEADNQELIEQTENVSVTDDEKLEPLEPKVEDEFRLEIPNQLERESLPSCDGLIFTEYPVDIENIKSITPLGNLGPPGHTFPTDHPHLHLGEFGNEEAYDIYAPADVYLTSIAWGDGMTEDPRDYVIYFALCKDIIAYYNHVKTVSPEIQNIIDQYECEKFSQNSNGCTKVIKLDKINAGTVIGTVGLKQGNFDFGLIDLRVDLDFVKPERYPERSRHIQCAFDYYPEEMRSVFYNLINRDDGSCSTIMQDVKRTLKGNWFHQSSPEEKVVQWDVYLAFVEHFQYDNVQVVSIAGKFTEPSLFHFQPRNEGVINRDFSQVKPGEVYCYQSEDIGYVNQAGIGKIIVKMIDDESLQIEHQDGDCNGNQVFSDFEVYNR